MTTEEPDRNIHDVLRKNVKTTRGRPFERGNPGRPKGSRNKATLAAEAILEGEAEALSRKAVDLALKGDIQALKLCLDRLIAPCRERRIRLKLQLINCASDATKAAAMLISAVTQGELSVSEAVGVMRMIETQVDLLVVCDFEQRLINLEDQKK